MTFSKAAYILLFALLPLTAHASDAFTDAKAFWSTFRQAVIRRNTSEIASMTRFPFEVHGVEDSDPVKRYGHENFPAIFEQVVSQKVMVLRGEELLEKTML